MSGLIQTKILHELQRELARTPKRQPGRNGRTAREDILAKYNAHYGVPRARYYKWIRTQNGKRRADAGIARKGEFWKPVIEAIFKIQVELSDFEIGRWCPSEVALLEAEKRGLIGRRDEAENLRLETRDLKEDSGHAGTHASAEEDQTGTIYCAPTRIPDLSTRYYNLLVEKFGLRKPQGFTRFQAEYSNQVHQFDVTGSVYLQVVGIENDDYLIRRRPPRERLKKEQKRDGLRLWVAGITDDFSGVSALKYVVHRGESAALCRQFLLDAWTGLDPSLPLRGLPDVIYCDNGGFSRVEETMNFLSAEMGVGVEMRRHEAYRARSGGKIERGWRTLKTNFETGFLSGQEYWTLSDVNRMLVKWCGQQSQKPHRLLPMSKAEAYLKNLRGEVRIPADDALRNAFRTFERTVDGAGVFRLDNQFYQLPSEMRSQRVLIYRNAAGEIVAECPLTGARSAAEIYEGPHAFGTFEGKKETEMERVAKRRDPEKDKNGIKPPADWGETTHRLATPLNPPIERGERATVLPFVASDKQESKAGPFTEAARFKDEIEAKGFVCRELGIPLLTFRKDYPQRWNELSELLARTLNREEIAAWASGTGEQLQRAIGAGGTE